MKKHIKNIILYFSTFILLFVLGLYALKLKQEVEYKQNSYTMTTFDYLITSPSKEQVKELKNNEIINGVFPCTLFNTKINGKELNIFLSDDINNYQIGLFNENTLVSGEFDEDGIMLDEKASKLLNVKIGEEVSVSLANTTFKFVVSGIYLTSSYKHLDNGLALAKLSNNILKSFEKKITYSHAFIEANNIEECDKLFSNYIPLGSLETQDEYVTNYKKMNVCPSYLTEEEWEAAIIVAYEKYKQQYLKQEFSSVVKKKEDHFIDIKEQIITKEEKIKTLCIGVPISILVIYTILSIVLLYSNREDDVKIVKDGNKKIIKEYYLLTICGSMFMSLLVAVLLLLIFVNSKFLSNMTGIILLFSLPGLIGGLITIPFITKYTHNIYLAMKRKKNEIN